jgi:hypothetical protein
VVVVRPHLKALHVDDPVHVISLVSAIASPARYDTAPWAWPSAAGRSHLQCDDGGIWRNRLVGEVQ